MSGFLAAEVLSERAAIVVGASVHNTATNNNGERFLMLGEVGVYGVLVPESDTAGLAALAGLALLLRHRR